MKFTEVVRLEKDIWAINEMERTIMYVINGTKKVLLIDTGFGITPLKKVIRDLCGEKPVEVVNTHAHEDHNSGNNQFEEVFVGRFDEVYSHSQMDPEKREIFRKVFFEEAIAAGYDFTQWDPGPAGKIRTVKTGDRFELGNHTLQVIEIPSHTMGSIALWEEKEGWMFSGDIVLAWQVWGHLTNSILTPSMSLKNYYESIERLRSYKDKIRWIFPAHSITEGVQPEGCVPYRLEPKVLDVYSEGIRKILDGKAETKAFHDIFDDGEVALFSTGGIVYRKERIE